MKHTKKCPECGGTEIYTKQVRANGHEPMLNLLRHGFFDLTKFDLFVCATCGLHEMFVDEGYLKNIPKNMKRHE